MCYIPRRADNPGKNKTMKNQTFTLREKLSDFICPENKTRRDELKRLSEICEATGAGNKRAFELARKTAERTNGTAIVLFDGNNFGQVNKKLSHVAGDKVLMQMAGAIRRAAQSVGMQNRVFRIGGDEFAVICPVEFAPQIVSRAKLCFGTQYIAPDISVSISGTFGKTFQIADNLLQAQKSADKKQ